MTTWPFLLCSRLPVLAVQRSLQKRTLPPATPVFARGSHHLSHMRPGAQPHLLHAGARQQGAQHSHGRCETVVRDATGPSQQLICRQKVAKSHSKSRQYVGAFGSNELAKHGLDELRLLCKPYLPWFDRQSSNCGIFESI